MDATGALERCGATLAATVVLMPVVIRLLSDRVLDVPNARSSHTTVTPRGGGLGPAVAATAVAGAWWAGPRGGLFAGTMVAAAVLAGLGLLDDLFHQPALVRLAGQVAIAGAAAFLLLLGAHTSPSLRLVALLAGAAWLVAFVNAFNFMDGINGISSVAAAGAGLTWVVLGVWQHAPALAVIGAVAAGGGLGFLPFNFPRARVFLGDVGSYFFGGLLGAGVIVGLRSGLHPEAVGAPLVLYVFDTGVTLIRRLSRGENVFDAHREHAYQRICVAGWSHLRTTGLIAGLLVALGGLGLLAQTDTSARVGADGLMVVVAVAYLLVPTWLCRRSRMGVAG